MRLKLGTFIDRLREGRYAFFCQDFRNFDTRPLTKSSLVYCDPPYLITCATYNEQDGWNEQCEYDLYALLDALDKRGIKFALSNVLSNKGKTNDLLMEWLEGRNYGVIHLNYSYSNSNYHTKDKTDSTDEVLIVNYTREEE
jgi:site-specific DNA-adenine methylase